MAKFKISNEKIISRAFDSTKKYFGSWCLVLILIALVLFAYILLLGVLVSNFSLSYTEMLLLSFPFYSIITVFSFGCAKISYDCIKKGYFKFDNLGFGLENFKKTYLFLFVSIFLNFLLNNISFLKLFSGICYLVLNLLLLICMDREQWSIIKSLFELWKLLKGNIWKSISLILMQFVIFIIVGIVFVPIGILIMLITEGDIIEKIAMKIFGIIVMFGAIPYSNYLFCEYYFALKRKYYGEEDAIE